MAMTKEDQGLIEMGFLCENQPLDFSNSNNLDKSKEKLDMKLLNKEKERFEGEALENKKRSRENASGSGKTIGGKLKDGKFQESDHEMHTWIERERRKKMNDLYASLHALLPQLPSKGDKLTIIDGAINYIRSLENTVEKLEKQKQESLQMVKSIPSNSISDSTPQQPITFQTWTSSNVVMNICGNEAQLCVCTTRKPDLLTTIAFVLEKHKIEVITANILCNGNGDGYMILAHTRVSSHESSEATSAGGIYKEAAEEIKLLIS